MYTSCFNIKRNSNLPTESFIGFDQSQNKQRLFISVALTDSFFL
jgi:hypothetical protein